MAVYTVQSVSETGVTPSYVAVSASDTFVPATADLDKVHILHVKNGGGSPDTVAVDDPNSQGPAGAQAFNPDLSVSVTNAQERMIRIVPRRHVASGTGAVTVTHSFTTSVTAAVFVA